MYQKHSETSKEAHHFNASNNSNAQRHEIYALIDNTKAHGMTGAYIASALDMQIGTVSARLIELQESGYILKTFLKRKNPSGCSANVYISSKNKYLMPEEVQYIPAQRKNPHKTKDSEIKALKAVLKDMNEQLERSGAIFQNSITHAQIKTLIG